MPTSRPAQRAVADAAPDLPAEEAGEGQEGAVGEVQHAHQPVDQREAAGDQEVERAEARRR